MGAEMLRGFDRAVGLIATAAVAIAALALLVSLGLVGWSVAMRYLFNHPVPWVDEAVGYLLVAIVMLAGADALRRGEHIAVDVVTEKLGARGRRVTAMAGMFAIAVVAAVLIVMGGEAAAFSRLLGIVSTGWLAMPMWLPQLLVPIGGVLLLLAALAGLARMAAGRPPFEPADTGQAEGMPRPGIE